MCEEEVGMDCPQQGIGKSAEGVIERCQFGVDGE
jgi:hypothetical protein